MKTLLILLLFFLSPYAFSETSSQGEIRMETRFFQDDDLEETTDYGYGIFSRLELERSFKNDVVFKARGYGRSYQIDESRNYFYLEDLYLEKDWGNSQFFVGMRTFNWSFAEAFHPNDIINARNFDSNFENAEKIGQPTVGFQWQGGNKGFGVYIFPTIVKPNLPVGSRLSFTPASVTQVKRSFVDTDGEEIDDDFYLSGLIFYDLSIYGGDFKLFWYHGHDREIPSIQLGVGGDVTLNYLPVDQIGFNIVKELDTFLIKSELTYKSYEDINLLERSDHFLAALGLEKSFFWKKGQETMLILEAQALFGAEDEDEARALNFFQRDLLVGIRHSLNDVYSQEFFISALADLEKSKELLLSVSYTRRLSDQWKINGSLRYIDAPQSGAFPVGFESLDEDHQLSISLSRFF